MLTYLLQSSEVDFDYVAEEERVGVELLVRVRHWLGEL